MNIKNIVFDVGNVLVRWDPLAITTQVFPEHENLVDLSNQIFKSKIWYDLNLGKLTEQDAIQQYKQALHIDTSRLQTLMIAVKQSLLPIDGSFELLKNLHQANFRLYALTDNTKEIMDYLKARYDFWSLFCGIVVSADVGVLKPSEAIYRYLLQTYSLNADETVFLDDIVRNVEGAKAVNIHGIQFENVSQCIKALHKLNVMF